MHPVHVAVTLRAQPGREAEFEKAVARFIQKSMDCPGTTGAQLIKPPPGSDTREYGVLRSFVDEESMQKFYSSALFNDWVAEVSHLIDGERKQRRLHGLEAFFRGDAAVPPPRWKMACVTWLGVYPCVLLWTALLVPILQPLPLPAIQAIVSVCMVVTLTWGVMPFMTKIFRPWLRR